ncbi:MAG TPA: hypothetical protein VK519_12370 [Pinirhizobacter sp.]|uniref:hypothetical protein n=1 Tax=Pinirhizobacter sp. TaxID=2950432 RepID=UPI002CF1CF73|nr:hypothetical protein [Pinirhizobacter sp.]HMH68699.1 hypothetical protein [Pinirhizobacter sp.]
MEQRVTKLEVEVVGLRRDSNTHSVDIRSIRESIADLVKQVSIVSSKVDKTDMRMVAFIDSVNAQTDMRMSAFADSVNTRFESVDARFGAVPTKLQVALWGLTGLTALLGGTVAFLIVMLRIAGYSVLAEILQAVKR